MHNPISFAIPAVPRALVAEFVCAYGVAVYMRACTRACVHVRAHSRMCAQYRAHTTRCAHIRTQNSAHICADAYTYVCTM
jgi:hypothetical protein